MKRKELEESKDIRKDFLNQKNLVSKNTVSKDENHKQALWDMYAYYGWPDADMFKDGK